MPETRRPISILTSVLAAMAADLTVAAIGDLTTPGRWLLSRAHTLTLVPPGRLLAVIGVLALMGVNGWLLAHRFIDDEAPGLGRLVVFLVLGFPVALLQLAVVGGAYLALT